MKTFNIQTVLPEEILTKEAFKRAVPSRMLTEGGMSRPIVGRASTLTVHDDPLEFEVVTQGDFLREFDINSHRINSIKYYPNPITTGGDDKGRKIYQKIKTRIAIGWQQRIYTKRLAALTGNNIDLRISNSNSIDKLKRETFALFREGWELKNIENSIFQAIAADGKVGDAAVCFFKSNQKMGWRVFSYDKGDTLYPHYDPSTGELAVFGRKYTITNDKGESIDYLDVWDNENYARYKWNKDMKRGEKNGAWEVDMNMKPHNFSRIPIAYHRYGAPFWANSQSLIEAHELNMSQLAENNMAYALRILVTMGEDMDLKTSLDGTPTRIDSPNKDDKAFFLEPADSSNSFNVELKALEQNIMRCSFAVETPEIKSGSDMSSLTVKMLFADSYQKALEDGQNYQSFLDDIVDLFKESYGTEIGKISDFNTLNVKAVITPWIFMSETETVNAIVQLIGIGAMSKKTGCEIAYDQLGYGQIDEYERVMQEAHDELVGTIQQQTTDNIINNLRNE